jgi:hypothetical protein
MKDISSSSTGPSPPKRRKVMGGVSQVSPNQPPQGLIVQLSPSSLSQSSPSGLPLSPTSSSSSTSLSPSSIHTQLTPPNGKIIVTGVEGTHAVGLEQSPLPSDLHSNNNNKQTLKPPSSSSSTSSSNSASMLSPPVPTLTSPSSPNVTNGTTAFDLFASNSSLSSLAGISSLESLRSLASIPSILADPPSRGKGTASPSGADATHRDLEATVTATNMGSEDGAAMSTDNGRLVTNLSTHHHHVGVEDGTVGPHTPPTAGVEGGGMGSAGASSPSAQDKGSSMNALVSTSPTQNRQMAINPLTIPNGQNFVDITEYLNMPQSEAAKKLNIPASTLSKRWKEAVRTRKWPWRVVCKLDKEIMTLLHNVPQGAPIPKEIEARLGYLMRKRQEELKPVVIRL